MSLTYQFDVEKLVQAVAFFASKGIRDLTKLKAAKLLYFTDKYHLLKYGRPVLGDNYACMTYGPVPSKSLNALSEALLPPSEVENPQRELFLKTLSVDRGGLLHRLQHPIFKVKNGPNLEVFSKTDIEALEATIKEYGNFTASQLVKLTHQDAAWRIPDAKRPEWSSVDIPYELFFADAPNAREILELAEMEQDDRDFADGLRRAGRRASREALAAH